MMRLQVGMVVFFLCVSGCAVQSKVDDSPETRDPESQAFIEWAADHMVALESLDTSAAGTDLESLQQILGPARLVGPGESRHDTREQLLLKGRLVRHLIEDLEFRALILEESIAHAESLDHYVTSDEGNLPDLPPGERAFEPVSEDVMDGALAAVGKTSFLLDLRGVEQDSSASRWLRKERQ